MDGLLSSRTWTPAALRAAALPLRLRAVARRNLVGAAFAPTAAKEFTSPAPVRWTNAPAARRLHTRGSAAALPAFRLPSLAWRGTLLSAVAVSALAGASYAGVYTFARAHHSEVVTRHAQLLGAATGAALIDSQGRLIGALPQPGSKDPRLILRVSTLPAAFPHLLVALEDGHAADGSLLHPFGLDLVSLARGGGCFLFRIRHCGASSLLMEAVRGSYAEIGGRGEGRALESRKTREILDTVSLSLDGGPESPRNAAFIADRLSYGFSSGGGTIWGLATASETVFGRAPAALTLSQQAVLAAAVLHPLRIVCPGDAPEIVKNSADRWTKTRDRALLGLRRVFPNGGAEAKAAADEIAHMAPPTPALLPADLTTGLDARQACFASVNLGRRAAMVDPAATLAAHEAFDGAGHAPILEIRLTTDMALDRAFRFSVESALAQLDTRQRSKLKIPLRADADGHAEALLAVAEADGQIRTLYINTQRPDMLDAAQRSGSIGKIPVALAAGRAGYTLATPLCDRRDVVTGVTNEDQDPGYDRCAGAALRSWSLAYGASQNLPVLDLARRLGDPALAPAAIAFGFHSQLHPGLAHDLVTGQELISPRNAMAAMQALRLGTAGAPARAPIPFIVAAIRTQAGWTIPVRRAPADLGPWLSTTSARDLVRTAAGAALREAHGTLAGTVGADVPLASSEVAKTGTVAAGGVEKLTIEKLVVGAGAGSRGRSYFGLLQAPSGALGNTVSAIDLWRALRRQAASEGAAAMSPRI